MWETKEILEEFCTFFIAGTETTANLTLMIVNYLALNPRVEQKAREEVRQHIQTDEDITWENLKKMEYLGNIQKEAVRMYGPVNWLLPREAINDVYLNGVPIKKGTQLSLNFFGSHYNPKYFPEPEVFKPERWEKESSDFPTYVSGGFSGGARTCIGKHLALL